MFETLANLFDQTALRLGEKEAILFVKKGRLESRITYSSLKEISDRVTNGLMEMGLKKGDRVILFMPKSIEQVVIHIGIQKVGAISVMLNPGFKRDEMDYFLKDTDAKIAIVGKREEALIRSVDERRPILSVETETPFTERKLFASSPSQILHGEGSSDDPAVLIYTSGTTGQPKGGDSYSTESDPRCKEHHPNLGDDGNRCSLPCPSTVPCPWPVLCAPYLFDRWVENCDDG